ncbi:hypothetical protein SAMN05216412_101519 [Nitrosospira multiformis]|uniref:Uncharacterized protein n=1 Tax=Nitrosospira multiformis TaxID=1231 RepID=A0A1H9Z6B2_9PROT|nr:hypothetical protein SAMN05216412_101519 [Nitrosospira multiformis]
MAGGSNALRINPTMVSPLKRSVLRFTLFSAALIGLSFFASDTVLAQKEALPFQHEKNHALPSGKKVGVIFREHKCKSGECRETDGGMWGMDSGVPRFVTETFLVFIDGQRFHIPEKFYRDLTNTRSLHVSEQNDRVVIELKGGDAAGAYTAHFRLGGMCGFERKICGEICSEVWEHSTWYNAFAYDWDPRCEGGIE